MKPSLLLISTYCLFSFYSCNETSNSNQSKSIEYVYSDFKHVTWSDLLKQKEQEYFVYIYSLTCSHCEEIKDDVLKFSNKHTDIFYYCEYCDEIPIINEGSEMIGVKNIEELGIVGTPSMFLISNSIVFAYFKGKGEIKDIINNSLFEIE